MSIMRDGKYYNDIYYVSGEYACPYRESPYYQMWQKAMMLIPKDLRLLEIGCGTGQFARMLMDNGYLSYVGFDFSEEAVRRAGKTLQNDDLVYLADAHEAGSYTAEHDFIICLEAFEHIKDYEVIRHFTPGIEIVFTVPDFDDPAHIRYFKSINDVVDRYKNHFLFSHIEKFERWFICKATVV